MRLSRFGERFTRQTGARELMEDLGAALASDPPPAMLGGGNPAHIPAMLDFFRARFAAVLADPLEFRRLVADYADPAGEITCRRAVADLLRRECGWPVTAEHIALTAGSQQGFFLLFNLLAGPGADGIDRRILLPLTPEYVGYADVGVGSDLFVARRPRIELLEDDLFKYRVDVPALADAGELAAVCVSRPTNPSGNVLTDAELAELRAFARGRDVPLIVDGAYGLPFPRIVFTPATPVWDEDVILLLSLSKLGLPGVRTGIVVARPEIVQALGAATAVTSLAVGSVGPVLVRDALASGELTRLAATVVEPWYRARATEALGWLRTALAGCAYRVHRPEGALFLWLWLPRLTIDSAELYRRLKARGVLVLSGHHFFPGLPDDGWEHRRQCLRITYASDSASVQRGLAILGEEVRRAHA
jgi:valine--pyruvate aminotransferase